jgi:hypothetical protein
MVPWWKRLSVSRREVLVRGTLSAIVAAVAIVTLVATLSDGFVWREDKTPLIWTAIWFFVAWRFLSLGVYVNEWGVKISNPIVTWYYPWRKVDLFELVSTGEMFRPKARCIALVTRKGKQRPALALSTSRLWIPLTEEQQAHLLAELNSRVPRLESAPAG